MWWLRLQLLLYFLRSRLRSRLRPNYLLCPSTSMRARRYLQASGTRVLHPPLHHDCLLRETSQLQHAKDCHLRPSVPPRASVRPSVCPSVSLRARLQLLQLLLRTRQPSLLLNT